VDYKLDFLIVCLSEMDHRSVPTSVIIFKKCVNISSSLWTKLEMKFNSVSLNIPSRHCLLFCMCEPILSYRKYSFNVVIIHPVETDTNRTFIPRRTEGFASIV
jgi:hypothetical protein